MEKFLFTSESVTDGHPDKICDQITDAILDEALRQDPHSKMAVEASIKDDFILIFGEANTKAIIDYASIAKRVVADIGYTEEYNPFIKVNKQSEEIYNAVAQGATHAGDQGLMFGYASNETEEYMPLAIITAHKLSKALSEAKKTFDWLRPDGKTQVTVEYVDGKPNRITHVVLSTQHAPTITQEQLRKVMKEEVILKTIDAKWLTDETQYFINPSGSFVTGGSFGDSGTTGRKIVVDTYGGMGRIGGGCFSSKDPSKVDRSAAYYARYVAKSVVANELADRCEVQLAYAIGHSHPLSVFIETFGTEKVSKEKIYEIVENNFDFSVQNIIDELQLLRPIYRATAAFGHFGREQFPWEAIKNLAV